MKVIIVDDERHTIENLRGKINEIPTVTVAAEFVNPLLAFEYLKENAVDIVFLDIEMYEMSGLEMAKQIKDIQPKTNIVFVTGYPQYMGSAFSLRASGYVMKPATTEKIIAEIDNLRFPVRYSIPSTGVYVQTFGNFEVFVNGKPLIFPRAKAKELFAYLIDRKGASATTAEIAAVLWEDKTNDPSLQSQTRSMISFAIKAFREAGVQDIIIKSRNNTAVDVSKITCDYYDSLNYNVNMFNTYGGEYMTNYSWAEMRLGALFVK